MTLGEKQRQFTVYLSYLILFINTTKDYACAVGEVERPQVLQDIYLKTGKSRTKNSAHLYKLAADIKIFKLIEGKWVYLDKTADYKFAGEYWEMLDDECVWGGRFGDNPATAAIEGWDGGHFQFTKV